MQYIWHDLRFAVRMLIKRRWFTVAAVIALALGIGANSAVFTLVNAVLLRGLPVDQPDRIVAVGMRQSRGQEYGVSLEDFDDFQRTATTIQGMTLVFQLNMSVSGDDQAPARYPGVFMTARGFDIAGAKTAIGRLYTAEDDRIGAPAVVVLGNEIWTRRYNRNPAVLGRTIRVNALDATVIGVMAEGMKFPFTSEAWVPTSQIAAALRAAGRGTRNYFVVGRLADGVTVEQAQSELTNLSRELSNRYPDTNKDMTATVMLFSERVLGNDIKVLFWSLMGAVAFVLLIACSNVANLLLAQAADRAREIAVRISLGATRWRITRQLLVESILLALIGGIVGLGLAYLGVRWFDSETQDVGKPYWMVFTMDGRVFAFFAIVSIATGIVFGLVPALHISKTNLNEVLKEGGRTGAGGTRVRRWTAALVVAQVALTLVLLAGAGYMIRSFLVLYDMDLGIDTSRLLTADMTASRRAYPRLEDRVAFFKRVDDRLAAIPLLESVTTVSNAPLGGGYSRLLAIEGRTLPGERPPTVTVVSANPRYFDTLGLRLLRGRTLTDADGLSQHSAVINRRMADMFFRDEDPLGRRIRVTEEFPTGPQPEWLTIVGISPTIRQSDIEESDPDPVAYVAHLDLPALSPAVTLVVRTRSDPAKATAMIRDEVRALDADMPLFNIRTMDERLAQGRWAHRVFGSMFMVFAIIALILSAVGLYGVTSYSVMQRTQEIGIRMALGAEPRTIRWLVLRRGFVQLSIGLTIGLAGALGVGRLLRSMLVQIPTTDPVTLIAIVSVLVIVAITACLWPAARATRLDPMVALRYE